MDNENEKTILISNDTKFEENTLLQSQQNANSLLNCMKKIDYLKLILQNKAFIPRYYEESLKYLKLKTINSIAFPMTCFCDINLTKLIHHMEFYGLYSIGMNKNWGEKKGIQPIHYINNQSPLGNDFHKIFELAFHQRDEKNSKEYKNYRDYIMTNLIYMKPIYGEMLRYDKYENKNFHDEKEWRFIPDFNEVDTQLPLFVPQEQLIPSVYNLYSESLKLVEKLFLRFEYNDIKYLIVPNEEDRNHLIKFLTSNIEANDETKYKLVSKIIIFNDLREDL